MSDNSKYSYLYLAAFLLLAVLIAAGGFLCLSKSQLPTAKSNLEVQLPKTSDLGVELPSEVKLLFLGDIMLDRYIRQVAEKKGYDFVFGNTDDILRGSDLVIGNLEGPITDNQSRSKYTEFGTRENLTFTFAPEAATVLSKHNIKLVNLGNNHILNFGESGLEQTKKYLDEVSVKYFCTDDLRFKIYDLRKNKIAFVCYNQFEKEAAEKTIRGVREVREKADVVILYVHWGKEYESKANARQKELARKFIDAGADLIIGTHPHVVQEKEVYNGKTIYYSLGNFIFDQYWNFETTKGLIVEVVVDSDGNVKFAEHQIQMKTNGQTVLGK